MGKGLGFGRRRLINQIITENWGFRNPEEKIFSYNELLYVMQEMLQDEGKQYLEGGATLRGHQIFRDFVKHLLYRNLANYDSMVLVTSEKGTGKSSAAIVMARYWCKLLGIQFSPKRHIAYNNADVMNKIEGLRKFEPLICLPGNTYIRIKIKEKEYNEKIKNLIGMKDFDVLTYNFKKDVFEWKTPEKVILTKEETIDTIELENGIKIQATSKHLFLTKNGKYKRVEELTQDDELVLNTKKCIVCEKEFFNQLQYAKMCSKECSVKQAKMFNYRKNYPDKARIWSKKRHAYRKENDICYRLKHNLHTRMNGVLKGIKTHHLKKSRTEYLIGCSIEELKKHLEKQFKEGMSWKNYGGYSANKWSIDHIIPLLKFDLKKEWRKCFHYTNIQPLWNDLNQQKGRWFK